MINKILVFLNKNLDKFAHTLIGLLFATTIVFITKDYGLGIFLTALLGVGK